MSDAMLIELAKEVRWKTLKLLETVDDAMAKFKPAGLNNTILWHAGHALVVVEHLGFGNQPGFKPQYPQDWFDKFSWKSQPATVTTWPSLAEVVSHLKEQRTRLLALLETLSSEDLAKVVGEAPRSRTLGGTILHGLHDEAGHQGEIHLLKKLYQLGR
jgi:hypothetical protein